MTKFKLFILSLLLISCSHASSQSNRPVVTGEMIKGVNYTGPARGPIPPDMISSVNNTGGNYIAFVPEAALHRQNLKVRYRKPGGWFGESMEASIQGIELARKNNLKVMLKPHLSVGYGRSDFEIDLDAKPDSISRRQYYLERWREHVKDLPDKLRSDSGWRGDAMPAKESDWKTLADSYTEFIMDYARLADSLDVELFCIGTELKAMALEKPDYWKELIRKVRGVYEGKLTYAANWDSYNKIEFWDRLDLIGIDAYFPLSSKAAPPLASLIESWKPYKKEIRETAQQYGKPVVFTEWGYESEDYAGEKPWEARGREFTDGTHQNNGHLNPEVQATLYEATFQSFWHEPWFAGVFVWRWSPPGELNRQIQTYNYSPIGKPAEQTLSDWFNKSGGPAEN